MTKRQQQPTYDALTLFAVLWTHMALLQCVKAFHVVANSGGFFHVSTMVDQFLFVALVLTVISTMLQPSNPLSLIALCTTHIVSLALQGSQSNHVVVAITIAIAVLCNYTPNRQQWIRHCSGTMLLLLLILYLVPWLHKLNKDWFDPSVSCASLFASGFLSLVMSVPDNTNPMVVRGWGYTIADVVIRTAPHQAVVIELTLPSLLILWRLVRVSHPHISLGAFKVLIFMAAGFHLMLCLPLPPMSVYPFSMVMVPMYVFLLPQAAILEIGKMIGFVQDGVSRPMMFVLFVLVVIWGVQKAVAAALGDEPMPLEYPPYGLWTTAVGWNITVWMCLFYATCTVSNNHNNNNNNNNHNNSNNGHNKNSKSTHNRLNPSPSTVVCASMYAEVLGVQGLGYYTLSGSGLAPGPGLGPESHSHYDDSMNGIGKDSSNGYNGVTNGVKNGISNDSHHRAVHIHINGHSNGSSNSSSSSSSSKSNSSSSNGGLNGANGVSSIHASSGNSVTPRGETVRERANRIKQLCLQQSNEDTDLRQEQGLGQGIGQLDYDGKEEGKELGEGIKEEILFPRFSYHMPVAFSLALVFALTGLGPYLGLRNYPALAMFSNLRTEGFPSINHGEKGKNGYRKSSLLSFFISSSSSSSSPSSSSSSTSSSSLPITNHLFVPGWSTSLWPMQQDTVTILATNLPALLHYQINLACYFTKQTTRFNTAFNVTNEFWITPPVWNLPAPSPFISYSIPIIGEPPVVAYELRKIISKMYLRHQQQQKAKSRNVGMAGRRDGIQSTSFFVTLTRNQDHDRITLHAPQIFEEIASSTSKTTTSPRKSLLSHILHHTKASISSGPWSWKRRGSRASLALVRELIEPLSWWQRVVYRFRSFDYHRSPCRH